MAEPNTFTDERKDNKTSESDVSPEEESPEKKGLFHRLNPFKKKEPSPVSQSIEEAKRKGREGRARMREEGRKKREEENSDHEEEFYVKQLSAMSISVHRPMKWLGTGFIYDEVMLKHKNKWDPNFPEKPERISEPYKRCAELGLLERCSRIETQYGTEDMVLLQHTQELLEKVKSTSTMTTDEQKAFCQQYDSIYCNQDTYEAALVSLGCVMELMEQILKQKVNNGLALVRPPGHHAMNDTLCGFCFFNNVAIAAKHAIDTLGVKKLLIVDWDVHHGQATQQMFYDDPRVLYVSIHRYEYGKFWPYLRESDYDFIGKGKGLGFNVNVPLNQTGMTDCDYLAVFNQVLLPMAYEFSPDLVLVSAGYDCAIGCPEFGPDLVLVSAGYDCVIGDYKGEMMVSPACFGHMTHQLMSLADGRICVCLEGGYCIKSLSESVALTLKALLLDPCPLLECQQEPSDSITESILNVIKVLRPYWTCFQYQDIADPDSPEYCVMEGVLCMPPRPGIKFMMEENSPKTFPLTYTFPEEVQDIYLNQQKFDPIIDRMKLETALLRPPYRVCIVYDDAMRAHRCQYNHPEDPDRITRIFDKHVEWDLVKRCLRIQSRMATEGELQLIHSSKYVEEMKSTRDKSIFELRELQSQYNSIFMNPDSYNCALLATGSLLNVVHAVLTNQASGGIAVVRPPGHHAEDTKCMGFCFFNSVAIAAKYAQSKFGLKRIMILDWDVHHGNGTQHQLYEDDSVLLINLHRYDNGGFYPMSSDGAPEMVGEGHGRGFNVNIAWNYGRMGDAEYIAAFHHIVMPIAYQFAPELVLVSAGFDSAIGDPLGGYMVSPLGYAHMTHMLSTLANGRVILSLEGGYNLSSISHSMAMCTSVLLGDPCPALQVAKPCNSAIQTIKDVIDVHKQFWSCLKFKVQIPDMSPTEDTNQGEVDSKENSHSDIHGSSDNPERQCNSIKQEVTGDLNEPIRTENADIERVTENSSELRKRDVNNEQVPKCSSEVIKEEVITEQVPESSSEPLNSTTGQGSSLLQGGVATQVQSEETREKVIQGNEEDKDGASGGVSTVTDDIDQLTEATSSLTIEGVEIFSDTVTIYVDDHPDVNFLSLLRGQQKTIEKETNSKIFFRGKTLETRGLDTPERIIFIHVYSNKMENVNKAVEKINSIGHIERNETE